MTTPHKATPSDWAWLEGNSTVNRCDAAWSRGLIELRARVEALEADGPAVPHGGEPAVITTQPTPSSSLVERVADALTDAYVPAGTWGEEARAAIREVATYIRQHNPFFELDTPAESDVWGAVAELLDQEVNRD